MKFESLIIYHWKLYQFINKHTNTLLYQLLTFVLLICLKFSTKRRRKSNNKAFSSFNEIIRKSIVILNNEFFSTSFVNLITQQTFFSSIDYNIRQQSTSSIFESSFHCQYWLKKIFAYFSLILRHTRNCQIWMKSSFFVKNVVNINLFLSFDRWKKISFLNSFVDFLFLFLYHFLFSFVIIYRFVFVVISFAKNF